MQNAKYEKHEKNQHMHYIFNEYEQEHRRHSEDREEGRTIYTHSRMKHITNTRRK